MSAQTATSGRLVIGLVVLAAALALTSCAAPPPPPPSAQAAPPPATPSEDDLQRQAQEHAQRVAAAMQDRPAPPPPQEVIVPVVQWLDQSPLPAASPAGGPMLVDTAVTVDAPPTPPTPAPEPAQAAPSRDQLAQQLLERIRHGDEPALARAVDAAALSVLQRRYKLEDADLKDLQPQQQQAVRHYHAVLSELAQQIVNGQEIDSSSLLSQLQSAAKEGPVAIRFVSLCRNVRSYGVYEPFESQTFLAGREQPMIVYVELEQFQTRKLDDGQHEVRLNQEIELYNESDGLAVWQQPAVEIVDQSRNRRRDFFVVQLVRLPARLGVGKYLLKIRVTDKHGGSIDETTVPIQMVADAALVKQ